MTDSHIFFKQTPEMDIFITSGAEPVVVKQYKIMTPELRARLSAEVSFLGKYRHPLLAPLLRHGIYPDGAELEYAYAPGLPLDEHLKLHPEDWDNLYLQLLHFTRWLAWHHIFIGDVKPQHIMVQPGEEGPVVRIIDAAPDRDWFTAAWAAPEQPSGRTDWQSNLYSFALILVESVLPVAAFMAAVEKNSIDTNVEKLRNRRVAALLSPSPEARPVDLDEFIASLALPQWQPPTLWPGEPYRGLLHFHRQLAAAYYSRGFSLDLSHRLFSTYCLGPLLPPTQLSQLKLPDGRYMPLPILAEQAHLQWLRGKVTTPETEPDNRLNLLDQPYRGLAEASKGWDFTAYNIYRRHLEAEPSIFGSPGQVAWCAQHFGRRGEFDLAFAVLVAYFNYAAPVGDDLAAVRLAWCRCELLAEEHRQFPLSVSDQEITSSFSRRQRQEVEELHRLKPQVWQAGDEELLKLAKSRTLSPATRRSLLEYLALNRQLIDNQLWDDVLAENEPVLLARLAARGSKGSREMFNYGLWLAQALECPVAVAENLSVLYETSRTLEEREALPGISSALHEVLPRLPEQPRQRVADLLADHYWQSEQYDRLPGLWAETPSPGTRLSVAYLLVKALDYNFKLEDHRRYRQWAGRIKTEPLFNKAAELFAAKAKKQEKDSFEKVFRLKLSAIERVARDATELKEMLAEANTALEQAELHQLLALEAGETPRLARKHLLSARQIFNRLGFFNRCRFISDELDKASGGGAANQAGLTEVLAGLAACNDLTSFIKNLVEAVQGWFGFDTVIPFVFDRQLDNFAPLLNCDYEKGNQALAYSTRILETFRRNHKTTLIYDADSMGGSQSIHRLKISRALLVPVTAQGDLAGTLYLHTRELGQPLEKDQLQNLQTLAAISGPMLRLLYEREAARVWQKPVGDNLYGMVGKSPQMTVIINQVSRLGSFPYAVLITGESGVGKELVAGALYQAGNYKGRLVSFNCSNIARDLFESELFGHMRGSFTGAEADKAGKIAEAENGMLFFDEIGDLPFELQAKLLRLLENRTYYPVGSNAEKRTNARFVFATNRDLEDMTARGVFRADLLGRIRQFCIQIPPLRDRIEDLPLLVEHFTAEFARENPGVKFSPVPERVMTVWAASPWKMNIRELKYEVFRWLVQEQEPETQPGLQFCVALGEKLAPREVATRYVLWVRQVLGSAPLAMQHLDMTPPTYYRWIKKTGEE